jgi:hypothetical protein
VASRFARSVRGRPYSYPTIKSATTTPGSDRSHHTVAAIFTPLRRTLVQSLCHPVRVRVVVVRALDARPPRLSGDNGKTLGTTRPDRDDTRLAERRAHGEAVVSLRVACDLDGTLADMELALQREAERLYGPNISLRGVKVPTVAEPAEDDDAAGDPARVKSAPPTVSPAPEKSGLTSRQMRRLWAHVLKLEDFWLSLSEIEPGSVARLSELASKHGWEVLFLTQRPASAGRTAQLQTQRWLKAHGFELPSVYVMTGSRGRVADALALDVVIDDRPENCLDVVTQSSARALLVWRDNRMPVPPAATGLGIEPVMSMTEALDVLERTTRTEKTGGFVDRLRAAIGL